MYLFGKSLLTPPSSCSSLLLRARLALHRFRHLLPRHDRREMRPRHIRRWRHARHCFLSQLFLQEDRVVLPDEHIHCFQFPCKFFWWTSCSWSIVCDSYKLESAILTKPNDRKVPVWGVTTMHIVKWRNIFFFEGLVSNTSTLRNVLLTVPVHHASCFNRSVLHAAKPGKLQVSHA